MVLLLDGLLDLEDDVRAAPDLVGVVDDEGALGAVVVVADGGAGAGPGLDEDLVAVGAQLVDPRGGERDAVLVVLDLCGDPDDGGGISHGRSLGAYREAVDEQAPDVSQVRGWRAPAAPDVPAPTRTLPARTGLQWYAETPARRSRQLAADVAVAVWCLLWVVVGVAVHDAVRALVTPTLALADGADRTAEQLGRGGDGVAGLPLVGEQAAAPLRAAAGSVADIAASTTRLADQVGDLAVLVGVLVPLAPVAVVLLLWLPARLRGARRAGAARDLLAAGADPQLFALRALTTQPLPRLGGGVRRPRRRLAAWRPGRHGPARRPRARAAGPARPLTRPRVRRGRSRRSDRTCWRRSAAGGAHVRASASTCSPERMSLTCPTAGRPSPGNQTNGMPRAVGVADLLAELRGGRGRVGGDARGRAGRGPRLAAAAGVLGVDRDEDRGGHRPAGRRPRRPDSSPRPAG